jgi:hypothetical protein
LWNHHPEPTGSRRATPPLLFQHRSGQSPSPHHTEVNERQSRGMANHRGARRIDTASQLTSAPQQLVGPSLPVPTRHLQLRLRQQAFLVLFIVAPQPETPDECHREQRPADRPGDAMYGGAKQVAAPVPVPACPRYVLLGSVTRDCAADDRQIEMVLKSSGGGQSPAYTPVTPKSRSRTVTAASTSW